MIFPEGGHSHEHAVVASNAEKVSLKSGAERNIDNGLGSSGADAADDEEVNIDSIRGKPKMRTLCILCDIYICILILF